MGLWRLWGEGKEAQDTRQHVGPCPRQAQIPPHPHIPGAWGPLAAAPLPYPWPVRAGPSPPPQGQASARVALVSPARACQAGEGVLSAAHQSFYPNPPRTRPALLSHPLSCEPCRVGAVVGPLQCTPPLHQGPGMWQEQHRLIPSHHTAASDLLLHLVIPPHGWPPAQGR